MNIFTTLRDGPGNYIFKRLKLPAQLPPPEEEKDVKTAIAAARAKKERKDEITQKPRNTK